MAEIRLTTGKKIRVVESSNFILGRLSFCKANSTFMKLQIITNDTFFNDEEKDIIEDCFLNPKNIVYIK